MKQRSTFLLLVLSLALPALASACGILSPARQVKLAPSSSLPSSMVDAPTTVREAYQFALANQEVLEKIPCYCGCGGQGHRNARDCFVKEVRADGSVVWDQMGFS